MINDVIIPNVEFSTKDIPAKPFFRHTKKISLKITETGITFTGVTVQWDEIESITVKFFNSNPYIQLRNKSGSVYSFYFENKFYYRHKEPWFGASEFLTKEFVKILEEKQIFSIQKLESNVSSLDNRQGIFVHKLWNNLYFAIPFILVIISLLILLGGLYAGPKTQFI